MLSRKSKYNKPKLQAPPKMKRESASVKRRHTVRIGVQQESSVLMGRRSENPFVTKIQYSYGVRDPKESFCGRIEFLSTLHSAIQSPKDERGREKLTVLSHMRVIRGLGGVGKTETARKYIVQYAESYDNFIWINAESEESITQNFLQLAEKKLGINIYETGTEKDKSHQRPLEEILEEVYNKLCVQVTLIIFDGVDGITRSKTEAQHCEGKVQSRVVELRRFLPPSILPPLNRPFILVTSKNQDFGGLGLKRGQIQPLDVFTQEESCQFIMEQLNLDGAVENNKGYARALGEQLGHLPLDLQQAVTYIQEEIENKRNDQPTFTIQNFVQAYQTEIRRLDVFDFEADDLLSLPYTNRTSPLQKIVQLGPKGAMMVIGEEPLESMDKLSDILPRNQKFQEGKSMQFKSNQEKMQGIPRDEALQKKLAAFRLPVKANSLEKTA